MSENITLPGFVDVHVHLREPGNNPSETIRNGSLAAAIGGYVLICDMPNNPGNPTWTSERLEEKISIQQSEPIIPVLFYAGSQPESDNLDQLDPMSKKAVGLKLYGAPTTGNSRDYTAKDFDRIVQEWHRVAPDLPIMLHAGKDNLADMIDLVADKYLQPLHICHVNDPHEVELKTEARSNGLDVTCGVCPHHLFKTSHDVKSQGWFARMQPPLATQLKSEELWIQLADGEIDLIESDYAPHPVQAKLKAEGKNPKGIHDARHTTCYGVPGIEHIGPIMIRQAKLGNISMDRLIDAMHTKPLEVIRRKDQENSEVDWRLDTYLIKESDIVSGSHMSPYVGSVGVGRVVESRLGNGMVIMR
jgi:dihydroorotase-like cyclic amidohydrolase